MNLGYINEKCRFMVGSFYSLNSIALSYVTFFLLAKEYSEHVIGLIISISCLIGGILQPFVGRLADRSKKFYWKNQLFIYALFSLIFMILLVLLNNKLCAGILYGLSILTVMIMMPLVNTASFYYTAHGIDVNFGQARGIGSVAFALVSILIGAVTKEKGYIAIPVIGVFLYSIFLLSILLMPKVEGEIILQNQGKKIQSSNFIKKYPLFLAMTLAVTFVLVLHNLINTYLVKIVERAGGSVDGLGIALAIAALSEAPVMMIYSKFAEKTKISSGKILAIASSLYVIRGIAYVFASSIFMVYFLALMQSLTYGFITAAKANYAFESVSSDDVTLGQSVMTMSDVLGTVAGSLIGGIMLGFGGVSLMLLCGSGAALIGSIIAVLVISKSR
ncbi:MAG: MFS transporter [Treponema sp.]|nr:MFS transporter [Treponema sp.]